MLSMNKCVKKKISYTDKNIDRKQLELALKGTKTGVYRRSVETSTGASQEDSWSINIEPLFGFFDNKNRSMQELINGADLKSYGNFEDLQKEVISKANSDFDIEFRLRWSDGSHHTLVLSNKVSHNEKGEPIYRTGVITEINKQKEVEQELFFIRDRLETALTLTSTGMFRSVVDFKSFENRKPGEMLDLNDDWMMNISQLYGYPANTEITQAMIMEHTHLEDRHLLTDSLAEALLSKNTIYQQEYRVFWKDGSLHWLSLKVNISFEEKPQKIVINGSVSDITNKKIDTDKIQHLATHDGLTGLANRAMFVSLLDNAIATSKKYNRKISLMMIDLDRFKVINDTLGHDAGDFILKEVSQRIISLTNPGDVVARLGADQFIVLLQEIESKENIRGLAKTMLEKIWKPIEIEDQDTRVSASIGITMYPQDGDSEKVLMQNAENSMHSAKESGKNNYKFYTQAVKDKSFEKISLEKHLKNALEKNELYVVYQAKVDLKTGIIKGVEALVRWESPILGDVSPVRFIPIAEETGMIIPIGKWVMRTAYKQSKAWIEQGLPPLCMAINLSPKQFSDESLLEDIKKIIKQTKISGVFMELELTESTVMQNPEKIVRLLKAFKKMGVKIAIDDFGTGYSSLSHIQQFPIDTLKVDRSFIRDLENSKNAQGIAKAIIAMAKTLRLTVVAEGVETKEQADFLSAQCCDEMQGYYFSKPIPSEIFIKFYEDHLKKPNVFADLENEEK